MDDARATPAQPYPQRKPSAMGQGSGEAWREGCEELWRATFDAVERAGVLLTTLKGRVPAEAAPSADFAERLADVEKRLRIAEDGRRQLAGRLVEAEQQTERLMNLYIATFQLHSTLEPQQVESTISEIALNLLGAESFALLLKRRDARGCQVAMREGIDANSVFAKDDYPGGDPNVDNALEYGVVHINLSSPHDCSDDAVAVVPLSVNDIPVGALVILRLVAHKSGFVDRDRELLDILAGHAANALLAAHLYSNTDPKQRTCDGLTSLLERRDG